MTKREINTYLRNTPSRYDKRAYDSFLKEHGLPNLPPAIHITGTNGKGSSARYIALCLEKSGYKVGLFTSPYFGCVNELATINGKKITNDFISEYIKKYDESFKKHSLSLFEIMTFISLHYFVANKVDYMVIEVGMGGLFDATNIFTPILSIITNIGLDHLEELGPTVEDIAEHKAGIIKEEVPLLLGEAPRRAEKLILDMAHRLNAPVYRVDNESIIITQSLTKIKFTCKKEKYTLGSGAKYEVNNAVTALNALEILIKQGIKIDKLAIKESLKIKPFSGRFTVMQKEPAIVVDGAHNPHAITALINDVKTYDKNLKVIFAAFSDKDYIQEIDLLILGGADVTLTTFDHPRATKDFGKTKLSFNNNHQSAIKEEINNLTSNDMLLIVGSLYFARLVIEEFKEGIYDKD
ncbi:MAG: bifunctional folylpolyglutamate synthase/dihydrofolate synthase [Bacilli bacterium]|jgi:dihydrofolate synthase/folylpolyglutamate synthase